MEPRELAHRVAEQGRLALLRVRYAAGIGWPAPGPVAGYRFCVAREPCLPALDWDRGGLDTVADDLLQGRTPALGFPWQWSAEPGLWHRAPDTGATWPRRFFAAVPVREGNPYGDARVVWEPARLQWLVGLGLLAGAGDGATARRAGALLEDALGSWLADNPPLCGVHYVSAMECALRLIAVCHALDLARGRLSRPDESWSAALRLTASHAAFVERRLSLHSSTGNHTIAEAAGLVYAGVLFPELSQAGRWRRTGLAVLAREAGRQILADGGGLEQAFCYTLFLTDLCGLVAALLRHHGETPPAEVAAAFERGRQFLASLVGGYGKLPAIGDGDDGHALSPFLRLALERPAQLPDASITTFPVAGYSLLRFGGEAGQTLLFDHGPLGMPPLFGHGHADALSLVLQQGGRELLTDPGTYTYSGAPSWRRYFRSTAAHNTVSVDGEDQAVQQTAFMWSAPYHCELVRAEQSAGVLRILARHDGYRRLGGIIHWRGVALHRPGWLLVWDFLEGRGRHHLRLHWQVAVAVDRADRGFRLAGAHMLEIEGGETIDCLAGSEDRPGGWRSVRYGCKEAINTLVASRAGNLPHEFVTRAYPVAERIPDAVARDDIAWFRRRSSA